MFYYLFLCVCVNENRFQLLGNANCLEALEASSTQKGPKPLRTTSQSQTAQCKRLSANSQSTNNRLLQVLSLKPLKFANP